MIILIIICLSECTELGTSRLLIYVSVDAFALLRRVHLSNSTCMPVRLFLKINVSSVDVVFALCYVDNGI